MQRFKVGGAVRDELMGQHPKDVDFVVVGETIDSMLARGFQQVGKDFPVFLCPVTRTEHALARKEVSTGNGHTDFEVVTEKTSLEDDLLRRDLTINAMAQTDDGRLVDPFGGQRDLRDRVLRHISEAFKDDPLRVLRVARFAARFDFTVAPETMSMMQQMVSSGMLNHLTPERVMAELVKGLATPKPSIMFRTLHCCGALKVVLPEIEALIGVPQSDQNHSETDCFEHTMFCVDIPNSIIVRFASLTHEIGVPVVKALCDRLKTSADVCDLAVLAAKLHERCHQTIECDIENLVHLLRDIDAFRRPDRLQNLLAVVVADSRGQKGFENIDVPEVAVLNLAFAACKTVDCEVIAKSTKNPSQIRAKIDKAFVNAIRTFLY